MTRTSTRLLAASGAVVLTALAAAPATAAAVVSRADANALTVSIAGNGQGTGTAGATYDGQETRTGETQPSPSPFSQDFVDLGVLTQQATAGDGFSAACAGVAGAGGGIVQMGDGSCLTPGDTVSGSLSDISLDAIGLEAPEGLPAELPQELQDLLAGLEGGAGDLDAIITEALGAVDGQLGPLGLTASFDAIEGRCRVEDGSPSGSAQHHQRQAGPQRRWPADRRRRPPGQPRPQHRGHHRPQQGGRHRARCGVDPVRAGAERRHRSPRRADRAGACRAGHGVPREHRRPARPLRDNLLSVVLNEQSRPTDDSIRVTALHAQVLPAAADAVGASLADVQVGNANCGPADRLPTEAAPAATPEKALPKLPTAVSAGVEGKPATTTLSARLAEAAPLTGIALGGLLIALAGVVGVRRHLG